ncbi:MAG: hypothetical protein A2Z20_05380 [Bdellovibrionales bacterium RBG_16_40_8]|nr:MAG: hypothetical protein A2Z20_05380 [Bdellovibrionales bacterium RBG_16_40_8]
MKVKNLFLIFIFFTGFLPAVYAHSVKGQKILSLTQWRNHQIVNAQNSAVRLSNRIAIIKATSGKLNEINHLESEKRLAAQSIELIKQLTIEDYFNVYLVHFAESDAILSEAARTMSKSEMARLLKALLKSKASAPTSESTSSAILTGMAEKNHLSAPKL